MSGSRGRGKSIARAVVVPGIVHLTLLCLVAVFLFPFVWMFSTSLKTDEDLSAPGLFPALPRFRGDSPSVRAAIAPRKPEQVSGERWDAMLPRLKREAVERIVRSRSGVAAPVADARGYYESAAAALTDTNAGRIGVSLWAGTDEQLLAAFGELCTPAAIDEALDMALARVELYDLEVRTLDAHVFKISSGAAMARTWTVESGDAHLLPTADATRLVYHFDSAGSSAVVLRTDFDFPTEMGNLHKLIVSLRADDSWHRCDVTLDVDGERWVSTKPTFLAQSRAMSMVFQPPTFDDQTFKPKTWVRLSREARGQRGPALAHGRGSLRLIIRPSSTTEAIWGKVQRNYQRAFDAVPFWRYVGNSVVLVVLTTVGTLFSCTFVAYGFARLNWPGRTFAFVILLATMMLPAQVTMIPTFLIWRRLGWYNTLNPMWVPAFFGSAFFIFLMVQHMKTIPRELEESARLDGLNAVQIWYYIILPEVKPAAAAIAIMTFMGAWNEFMGPLIYLRDQARFPLSLGLFGLRLESMDDWGIIMAGNMIMTLPVIVIFFLCQRYFVQGMTMTGMK